MNYVRNSFLIPWKPDPTWFSGLFNRRMCVCEGRYQKDLISNFIFGVGWKEAVADALVCGTFPDLACGFDVTRFSGRAQASYETTRLEMSSSSIFGGMGVVVIFFIFLNILFGMLAERRKNIFDGSRL